MLDTVGFQVLQLVLLLSGCIYIYFIPSAIAYSRRHKYIKSSFTLNLLIGWTGVGWIGLLIWSLKGNKREGREETETREIVTARLHDITQS
jgi:hypothetical protein